MTIKLRAPKNSGGVTHDGVDYQPEEDGTIEVANERVAHALSHHGFVKEAESGMPAAPENMDRSQLVSEVMRRTLAIVDHMSDEDIRARLLATNPEDMRLPTEEEAAGVKVDATAVTAARIDSMSRVELFAYLRESHVAVAPPIKNADLRRIAHETLVEAVKKDPTGVDPAHGADKAPNPVPVAPKPVPGPPKPIEAAKPADAPKPSTTFSQESMAEPAKPMVPAKPIDRSAFEQAGEAPSSEEPSDFDEQG